ncbi:MAG: SRPBCC family protein [Thermoleophilaceae bacterium]|nr:SRPBCC family protein [Thermoleophilaceae bacterium]
MKRRHAERQIVVGRSPQECFDTLVDFQSYPSWLRAVKACEVQSRDRDGRGRRVCFEVDARVRLLSFTLDYSYESPHLITWEFVEGDVREVNGELVLEDRGDGTTLATYALRIEPGASMPKEIGSALNDQVMKHSVEDLKARVETGS